MGNTTFITDDAGAIIATYAYGPYGEPLDSTGGLDDPFTWQGQYGVMHEGGGLYYMRARYYDSGTIRFLSRDPVESGAPKSVNPYQYAAANPLLFLDPTGLEEKKDDLDQGWDSFYAVTLEFFVGEIPGVENKYGPLHKPSNPNKDGADLAGDKFKDLFIDELNAASKRAGRAVYHRIGTGIKLVELGVKLSIIISNELQNLEMDKGKLMVRAFMYDRDHKMRRAVEQCLREGIVKNLKKLSPRARRAARLMALEKFQRAHERTQEIQRWMKNAGKDAHYYQPHLENALKKEWFLMNAIAGPPVRGEVGLPE